METRKLEKFKPIIKACKVHQVSVKEEADLKNARIVREKICLDMANMIFSRMDIITVSESDPSAIGRRAGHISAELIAMRPDDFQKLCLELYELGKTENLVRVKQLFEGDAP